MNLGELYELVDRWAIASPAESGYGYHDTQQRCHYDPLRQVLTDPSRLRPIDADLQIPDTSKFRAHTGWEPEISFETTMLDLLDYWRQSVRSQRNYLVR